MFKPCYLLKKHTLKHQCGSSLIQVAKIQQNVNGQGRSSCGKTDTLKKHYWKTHRIGTTLLRNNLSILIQ